MRIQGICTLVVVLFALLPASFAATYYVGSCHSPSYSTISDAVAAAPSGSTVKVCPGTYAEQVFITKGLTLKGMASGNSGRVTIVPPPGVGGGPPAWQFVPDPNGSATMVAPMIYVNNPDGAVSISDITTDSSSDVTAKSCGDVGYSWTAGILAVYLNRGGQGAGPMSRNSHKGGVGCDIGIWVWLAAPGVNWTFVNNSIQDASYAGIYVECPPCLPGQTPSLNISGNMLNVSGAGIMYQGISGKISSNTVEKNPGPIQSQPGPPQGIVDLGGVASDASLTVTGNTVTKAPGPPGSPTTGIDVSVAPVMPMVSSNKISGFDTGIALPSGATSGTVKSNTISSTSTAGINLNCNSNPAALTITGNTVNGTAAAVSGAPNGYALSGITVYNADRITDSCPGVNRRGTKH